MEAGEAATAMLKFGLPMRHSRLTWYCRAAVARDSPREHAYSVPPAS